MSCAWARPELLTQTYGVACTATFAALALARASCTKPSELASTASAPLLASPGRETWVDSARFVLMVFIIMGHYVCVPCSYIAEQSYWLSPLLVWINLFVMPGFAALSGYLSKGPLTQARISRLLVYVLAPYIMCKLIYWTWFSITFRTIGYMDLFDAYANSLGLEWYLIVLVQWRLAIMLMSPLNKWTMFGIAVAAGLVSGNWVPNSAPLALQRCLSFFPFFVIGYLVDLGHFRDMVTRTTTTKVMFRSIFVGALAIFFCFPTIANLFMSNTLGDLSFDYASSVPSQVVLHALPSGLVPVMGPQQRMTCGSEWFFSFVHRLIRYQIGTALLLGLLAWIPTSSPTMAHYGQHTMYPYLIHPWIFQIWLMPLMNKHILYFVSTLVPFSSGGYVWLLAVLVAPVLALALSTAPVRFLTSPAIEPTWLGALMLSSEAQLRPGNGSPDPRKADRMQKMPIASV